MRIVYYEKVITILLVWGRKLDFYTDCLIHQTSKVYSDVLGTLVLFDSTSIGKWSFIHSWYHRIRLKRITNLNNKHLFFYTFFYSRCWLTMSSIQINFVDRTNRCLWLVIYLIENIYTSILWWTEKPFDLTVLEIAVVSRLIHAQIVNKNRFSNQNIFSIFMR